MTSLTIAVLSAGAAYAQAPASPAIGRLFFTPQQRHDLDSRRLTNVKEVTTVVASESSVTVNGHVSRSSGKSTTWMNGVPQHDAYRPRTPDAIPVARGDAGGTVSVPVGQTLDKASAAITDNLQGGVVRVERPARREP